MIDLKKLEKVPNVINQHNGLITVIVKLNSGFQIPSYIDKVRSSISDQIFTAEVSSSTLKQMESDPAVHTISISKPIQQLKEQ